MFCNCVRRMMLTDTHYALLSGSYNYVHRIVYETFVSEIPKDYQVDHINFVRDDNRLCNLRLLTSTENLRRRRKPRPYSKSEFGRLFMEHYDTRPTDNWNLYQREYSFYKRHDNTCSWQMT